jgi:hypothetical protein
MDVLGLESAQTSSVDQPADGKGDEMKPHPAMCFGVIALAISAAACQKVVLLAPQPPTQTEGGKVEVMTGSSVTIRTFCDKNGNCNPVGTTGAPKPAKVTCTEASAGSPGNPGPYPPACTFWCNPNCGSGSLIRGQSGNTSTAGTITLNCSGQCPLACSLRVDVN